MLEENKRTYTIERANWRDLLTLSSMEKKCFGVDAWPLIDIMGVLAFPGYVRLRAVRDDKLVGFIAGDPRKRDNTGWILTLGVLPEWRRQGIASALLSKCEEQLRMPKVKLTVRRGNTAAIRLYEKLGYQQVDVWSEYYRGGVDGLVLAKEMLWV